MAPAAIMPNSSASVHSAATTTAVFELREQPDTICSTNEGGLDKIEVLQRSASMDITYALIQERTKKAGRNSRGAGVSLRSRSSHAVGRSRRPTSPLAGFLNKRTQEDGDDDGDDDDEEDEDNRELFSLNRRWQAILVDDVEKLRGAITTTKTSSNVTNQDDDTILVKNSAVNYTPSANYNKPSLQKLQQQQQQDEELAIEKVVEEVEAFKNITNSNHNFSNSETTPTTLSDNPTMSLRVAASQGVAGSRKKTKRNRFFHLLHRKKADEEKRFAEIVTSGRNNGGDTASGFFSNKKQPSFNSANSGKRKHFSLTPFPTPPRSVRTVSPVNQTSTGVKHRIPTNDLTSDTTVSTLTTNTKSTKSSSGSTTSSTKTERSADEILRDLSLSSSASTCSSKGGGGGAMTGSIPSSTAPTKAQIAAAIANPEKSLKRAQRYRKEATRLLNSVSPDTSNVLARCSPQENPKQFRGRAKKAYQYAAEARRIYDLLEKVESNHATEQKAKENKKLVQAQMLAEMKERRDAPGSAQSISSDDTNTDGTTFSEKLAREELQTKMKELELFSEFDLATTPKMALSCNDRNSEDHLGAIYAAEARRIIHTFSDEQLENGVLYASPVPSYEEMSVLTSVTERNVMEEHRARMAELKLFTTETIANSLQNSFKQAVQTMTFVREKQEENKKKIFDLFRPRQTDEESQAQTLDLVSLRTDGDDDDDEDEEEEEESLTSAHPRFAGYNTSCQLGIINNDDMTDASFSTAGQGTVFSARESVVSNDDDDDESSANVSQSLYTVEEDDGSSEEDDETNYETIGSQGSRTTDSESEDDESVASASSQSSDGSTQSGQTSLVTAKTNETDKVKGFAGWIRGF